MLKPSLVNATVDIGLHSIVVVDTDPSCGAKSTLVAPAAELNITLGVAAKVIPIDCDCIE